MGIVPPPAGQAEPTKSRQPETLEDFAALMLRALTAQSRRASIPLELVIDQLPAAEEGLSRALLEVLLKVFELRDRALSCVLRLAALWHVRECESGRHPDSPSQFWENAFWQEAFEDDCARVRRSQRRRDMRERGPCCVCSARSCRK